jgi:hypothetical protein
MKINLLTMIKVWSIFLATNLFSTYSNAQCDNDKARNLYLKSISIIDVFHHSEVIHLGEVIKAMKDLESITLIGSECDVTFIGRFQPTVSDLRRWQAWYDVNKECLCIDKDTGKLYYVK